MWNESSSSNSREEGCLWVKESRESDVISECFTYNAIIEAFVGKVDKATTEDRERELNWWLDQLGHSGLFCEHVHDTIK